MISSKINGFAILLMVELDLVSDLFLISEAGSVIMIFLPVMSAMKLG